jgi:hypothetical protein
MEELTAVMAIDFSVGAGGLAVNVAVTVGFEETPLALKVMVQE